MKLSSAARGLTATLLSLAATAFGAGETTAQIQPYLESAGKPSEPSAVHLRREAGRISAAFEATQEGTYSFGITIEASELAPLGLSTPPLKPAALAAPVIWRYPYDWTALGLDNVLNSKPHLMMPGVIADGKVYVVDTRELFSLKIERGEGGKVKATLLKHRFYNDGGDAATPELQLKAGAKETLDVLVFDSVEQALRARYGEPEPMTGWDTQPAYSAWTDKLFGPEQYQLIARMLQGQINILEVREVNPEKWIPPILHAQGMKADYYLFFGTLRRETPQVTPEIEAKWSMKASDGKLYTAPRAPDGAWLLLDLRKPEARALLVAQACAAVSAGYDGVSFDGYPVWMDTTGRYGGNCPDATCSLQYARWLFLKEVKAGVRAVNPKATVGILANQVYDTLNEADWLCKERMYYTWETTNKVTNTAIRQDLDLSFEEKEAPYVVKPLMYGCRGVSPISVWSSVHFIRKPTGLYYTDAPTLDLGNLKEWLETIVNVRTHSDLYIAKIEPRNAWIHFTGLATIHSDVPCKVVFSLPVALREEETGTMHAASAGHMLAPKVKYTVLREDEAK